MSTQYSSNSLTTDAAVGLSIHGLKKSFGKHHVLNGVDLEVAPSESLVVLGQSGTGKSVLLRCIMGLENADHGSIKLDGHEVLGQSLSTQKRLHSYMGMVFQGAALFDSMTILENIIFALKSRKHLERLRKELPLGKESERNSGAYTKPTKQELKAEAFELLRMVGLNPEQVAQLSPSEISGGMQRRVSIARTIATRPRILLLDEPTAGLDPIATTIIDELIIKSHQKLKSTLVTITHDLKSALRIATRIAMLHEGKVIWIGTPAELKKCSDPIVKQFIEGSLSGPIKTGGSI